MNFLNRMFDYNSSDGWDTCDEEENIEDVIKDVITDSQSPLILSGEDDREFDAVRRINCGCSNGCSSSCSNCNGNSSRKSDTGLQKDDHISIDH